MNTQDQAAALKTELAKVNDQINDAQQKLTDLKTRRQQILADAADLQAFQNWKQANP